MTHEFFTAISIKQPWAYMILNYPWKSVENRTWNTSYRGPLIIHSSKTFDFRWQEKLEPDFIASFKKELPKRNIEYPTGCLCGAVTLDTVIPQYSYIQTSKWHELECFGHHYTNPINFPNPLKYKGELSLFKIPATILPTEIIIILIRQYSFFNSLKATK